MTALRATCGKARARRLLWPRAYRRAHRPGAGETAAAACGDAYGLARLLLGLPHAAVAWAHCRFRDRVSRPPAVTLG